MPIDKNGIIKPLNEPFHCNGLGLDLSTNMPDDAMLVMYDEDRPFAFIAGKKEAILVGLAQVTKKLKDSLTYNN